ncbi:MAG: hypothetical protein ACPGVF_02890 [Flavobacteriaceae bacterium]
MREKGPQSREALDPKSSMPAWRQTGIFGYVGATFSGVGLAYITQEFGWEGMFKSCIIAALCCLILVMMTWKKEKR